MATTTPHDVLRKAFAGVAPEGIKVPVRTGRVNEQGQNVAKVLALRLDCAPDAVIDWLLIAAGRALVAEKLNGDKVAGGVKLRAAEAMFSAINAGETPQAFTSPTRGTTGGLDADAAEAVAVWSEMTLAKVGAIIGVDPAQRAHAASGRVAGRELIATAMATDDRLAALRPFVVAVANVWHLAPPAVIWEKLSDAAKAGLLAKVEEAKAERAKLAEATDVASALDGLI